MINLLKQALAVLEQQRSGTTGEVTDEDGQGVYIGAGTLVVILIIVLLIMLL